MRWKYKKGGCWVILLLGALHTVAQNNPIFKGGPGDGWSSRSYIQNTPNLYVGGTGDGWGAQSYVQGSIAIYKGGDGDGWARQNYVQASTSIYKGGEGDGWAVRNYVQATPNIYYGGQGDGWSFGNYMQSSVVIYRGGEGDGWSNRNYTQSNVNINKGGMGDGWASTYTPLLPLPLTLLTFTAQKQGNNASLIQWKTSSEKNTHYFDVERSSDAINFGFIGKVNAAGNSSTEMSYSFTDNFPLKGLNYYRLKQVDVDGRIVYSPARLVRFEDLIAGQIKYYPNPTNGILNIELSKEMQQEAMVINISNAAGIMMNQIKLQSNSSNILMVDMKRYAKGTYFIQVKTNTTNSTQRVVLQ